MLARPLQAQSTTERFASLALAALRGRPGYLPGSWQQQTLGMQIASKFASTEAGLAGELQLAYDPPPGSMDWGQGYPASLAGLWQPGTFNVILRGAVMAFQSEHKMTINGNVDGALWNALFKARSAPQNNVNGYTYAVVSKGTPETLTIWHDGPVVQPSLANTGIPSPPTLNGTFPLYERVLNTITSATHPNGSPHPD